MRRDNHACRYCGATAPDVKLTIDHVTPTTLGGSDDPSNLVTACADCNAGKSATPPDAALVADVDQRAVRWAQAMQVVIERRTGELAAERKRLARFDRKWQSYSIAFPRDANWKNSVLRFLAAGLDDQFLADAADTAIGNSRIPANDVWRYFCGICWREVDAIQKATRDLVDAEPPAREPSPDARPSFDYMAMFDEFLDEVITALGGTEQVVTFANRTLWDAMPDAHAAWNRALDEPMELGEDEVPEDIALAAAREELSMVVARDMWQVQQWRESRDRSLGVAVEGSTHGS
jgi:hypothetical protein